MLEIADQKRKRMYHKVNESIDSTPNRTKSGLVVLEPLAVVYNIGNSIRELDMSIESLAFDLRHRKGSKKRTEEQLAI